MNLENRQWLIAAHPTGRALRDQDFRLVRRPVEPLQVGQVLVKVLYLGFDPAQRAWLENRGDYMAQLGLNDLMRAQGLGIVLQSRAAEIQPGDHVMGLLGWQDYAVVAAAQVETIERVDLLSAHLGVLGVTGMTAYLGLQRIGRPFPGDTLVITSAAGATGAVVGQIGRLCGCRVIGIAGGPSKAAWLMETCGFEAVIDYKAEDVSQRLAEVAPDGVDIVWDNVGGAMLDDLLARIAPGARIVICGGISRLDGGSPPPGPRNYFNLVYRRAEMRGFIVTDWTEHFPVARARLAQWVESGQISWREDIQTGLENAPATLRRLFEGRNEGKQLLKL